MKRVGMKEARWLPLEAVADFAKVRIAVTVSAGDNTREDAQRLDRIVIQDRKAARRWLLRAIAERAVQLYRERKEPNSQACHTDDIHEFREPTKRKQGKRARTG